MFSSVIPSDTTGFVLTCSDAIMCVLGGLNANMNVG